MIRHLLFALCATALLAIPLGAAHNLVSFELTRPDGTTACEIVWVGLPGVQPHGTFGIPPCRPAQHDAQPTLP